MPLRADDWQFGTTGGNPREIRPSSNLRPCIHRLRSYFFAAQNTNRCSRCRWLTVRQELFTCRQGWQHCRPDDYRDKYETLGTYFVLDPAGNQMHMTYASPGAAAYFRQNGKFADGTVLIKEVFGTEHAQMTTGDAHWASGTKVWFVMMKDDKGRYANSKLWGDGWGWALYKSDAPDKQVAVSYKKDCQGCHIPAQKTDWIYTQGYPVLHSSK